MSNGSKSLCWKPPKLSFQINQIAFWSSPLIHTVALKGHHYISFSLHYINFDLCEKNIMWLCIHNHLACIHNYLACIHKYLACLHNHGWPSTQPGSLHTALQRKYTQPCSLFSRGTAVWTMGARLCPHITSMNSARPCWISEPISLWNACSVWWPACPGH